MSYLYEVLNIDHFDVRPSNFLKMDEHYNICITEYGIEK